MNTVEPPKPPRWVRLAVWVAFAAVCWLGVGVLYMLASLWPAATGIGLLCFGTGFALGARRSAHLVVQHNEDRAVIDRWNNSAARDDLAEAGPVTGEQPAVNVDAGPDDTSQGTLAYLQRPYDQAAEEPLCSWCPAPAVGRIDITVGTDTWRDLPACGACPTRIRVGDLDPAAAIPDLAATYRTRLA